MIYRFTSQNFILTSKRKYNFACSYVSLTHRDKPDKHIHSLFWNGSLRTHSISPLIFKIVVLGGACTDKLSLCVIWQHKNKQSPLGQNDQKLLRKAGNNSRWTIMKNRPQFIQTLKHKYQIRAIIQVTEICTAFLKNKFWCPHVFSCWALCIF